MAATLPTQAGGTEWSPPLSVLGQLEYGETVLGTSPSPRGGATLLWSNGGTAFARQLNGDGTLGGKRRTATRAWTEVKPAIAVDAAGRRFVAWYGPGKDDAVALYAQRIGARGELGPVRTVAANTPTVDFDIAMAIGRGGATIAWTDARHEIDPSLKGYLVTEATVFARRLGADGRLGPAIRMPGDGINQSPRVIATPTGRTTVVWHSRTSDAAGELRAATLSESGAVGAMRSVSGSQPGVVLGPPILATGASGDAFAAWRTAVPGPMYAYQYQMVIARRVAANGDLGPILELTPPGSYYSSSLAVDDFGTATVAWSQWLPTTRESVVQGRRIDASDAVGPIRDLSTPGPGSSIPRVAIGRSGKGAVVWTRMQPHWQGEGEPPAVRIEARTVAPGGDLGPTRVLAAEPIDNHILDFDTSVDGRNDVIASWSAIVGERRDVRISRLVSRCSTVRTLGAVSRTDHTPGLMQVRGVRVRPLGNRPASFSVDRASLAVVRKHRPPRLLRVPLASVTTSGRDVHAVLPKRLRRTLRLGQRVSLRLQLRARPLATGCPFGMQRTVKVRTRVGWANRG